MWPVVAVAVRLLYLAGMMFFVLDQREQAVCAPTISRRCSSPRLVSSNGFPGRRYEEWVLDDPAGQDVEGVRPIRDNIEERVRRLLTDLGVAINA